jgi:hypothetical protein
MSAAIGPKSVWFAAICLMVLPFVAARLVAVVIQEVSKVDGYTRPELAKQKTELSKSMANEFMEVLPLPVSCLAISGLELVTDPISAFTNWPVCTYDAGHVCLHR